MPVRRIGGTRYRNSCLDLAVQAFGPGTRSRVRDRELHEDRKHVPEPARIVRHRRNRLCCLDILDTEAQQVGIATSIYDMVLVRERDLAQGTRDRLNRAVSTGCAPTLSFGPSDSTRPSGRFCRAGVSAPRRYSDAWLRELCTVSFGMELRIGTISSGKWPDGSLASPVKRGRYPVRMTEPALAALDDIEQIESAPCAIINKSSGRLTSLFTHWQRIRKEVDLDDIRVHYLRHSYASRALALGESLTMIGKLLGHTQVQTTARYAHLARDSIQTAAARIRGSIGGNLSSVQGGYKTTRQ